MITTLTQEIVGASAFLAPSGGDDSAAMANALTNFAPFVSPVVALGAGIFRWNSQVPGLLRSTPARVIGAGVDKTTIRLSSGAPRAFDFTKIADYDTARNIEISGFTVDDNNVGGSHHLIFGNYRAGVVQQRLNFDRIYIHDIRVINAPVDPTGVTAHLFAIHLNLTTTASNEATQITATNLLFERIDVAGSGTAIYVGGNALDLGTASTPNAFVDNVTINDLRHDLGSVQSSDFASCHVQIGQNALVGTINVNRLRGYNSGDTGIELDNIRDGYVNDCIVTDSFGYSFYKTNFNITPNANGLGTDWSPNAQFMRYVDCRGVRQNLLSVGGVPNGRRFVVQDSGNNLQIGTMVYTRCSVHTTALDVNKAALGEAFYFAGLVNRVIVRDCEATTENIASASGTNSYAMVYVNTSGSAPTALVVRGLRLRASTPGTGGITGGTINVYGIQINQATSSLDMLLDIDEVDFDFAVVANGGVINNLIGIDIGRTLLRAGGIISNWKSPNFGTYAGKIGINIGATTTFTCRTLVVRNSDFTNAGNEINFGGSGATSNASTVLLRDTIRWNNNNATRQPSGRTPTAASYTMSPFDTLVAVTSTAAARTVTLPAVVAVPPGLIYEIVDESNAAGTNNITAACAGTDTFIGGAASKLINANGANLRFYSNGTNWFLA